ncbi:PQQ-binding-like beta-propeller repeat protein [Streptomyces sp. NPDC004787]|uniref:outer membrane protein assembly factor BamB family protein n=1 Tax=Streptomyces sp. NPDC004787 TaxID=3154291 RepID=UPI0033BCA46B
MTTHVHERPSGRRTACRTARAGAVLVALCTLLAGCGLSWAEDMDVAWDTPVDRRAEPQGEGAWLSGDTLVHSRFDAVRGYDASTGERRWEYAPPGRSAVCHATADTGAFVLVLTRDADGASASAKGKACATVVALDMRNGRELWRGTHSATDPGSSRLRPPEASAGAGLAVLPKDDGLSAVDVRTGKPRWKAALPKGCVPGRSAVAAHRVAALLACGGTDNPWGDKVPRDAELHVAAFSPATGALLWSAPLGGRTVIPWDTSAAFVAAEPVVVAASSSGDSDIGAYYSFGGDGRPNPPIDFSGSYGEITRDSRLTAVVDDTRLYVAPRHRVRNSRLQFRLTAFDLATGSPVWGGTLDDDRLDGDTSDELLLQDGELTALAWSRDEARLHVLDPATGARRELFDLPDDVDLADAIFTHHHRLVVARYGAYQHPYRPFTAYARD